MSQPATRPRKGTFVELWPVENAAARAVSDAADAPNELLGCYRVVRRDGVEQEPDPILIITRNDELARLDVDHAPALPSLEIFEDTVGLAAAEAFAQASVHSLALTLPPRWGHSVWTLLNLGFEVGNDQAAESRGGLTLGLSRAAFAALHRWSTP